MQASAIQVQASLAAYFAVVGVMSPYLGLYFDALGMSASQIAMLLALPQITRIIAPPFWGWIADRSRRQDLILRLSSVAMLCSIVMVGLASTHIAWVAVALILFYLFSAAQMPLVEAFAVEVAGGHAGKYGNLRVWGSIGFIVAVVICGPLLDRIGRDSLPWVILPVALWLIWTSFQYQQPAIASYAETKSSITEKLKRPEIMAMLGSCMFHVFAHSALYAFFSLYLARQGYNGLAIGLLWGFGVIIEILWFRFQQGFFARYAATSILVACSVIGALRFTGLGLIDGLGTTLSVILILVLLQTMHAITFAAHHTAAMSKMHQWFSTQEQSRAQSFFVALVYGVGGTLGTACAGVLWDKLSPSTTFLVAGLASAIAALIALVAKLKEEEMPE